MFLKSSLPNTRKFFTRTIQSVKSFFNQATYQRLSKTPPSQSYGELHRFTDFSNIDNPRHSKKKSKKNTPSTSIKGLGRASKVCDDDSIFDEVEKCSRVDQKKKRIVCQRIDKEKVSNTCTREEIRRCLVAKKLKELEGMDLSNTETMLDIEEALHYFSHLTSPVYMELFDKFFMNIYADLISFKLSRHAVAHCVM